MLKILFVCTGNTCRSPMAEALLKKKALEERREKDFLILSAGLAVITEGPASKEAREAVVPYGMTLEKHRSRQLSLLQVEAADLVLTMTERHKWSILREAPSARGKVFGLGEYARMSEDVRDPFGGSLKIYQQCAADIDAMLTRAWPKILRLADV